MIMTQKIDDFIKHKGLKGRREFAVLCGIPYTTIMSFYDEQRGYGNVRRETLNKMKFVMGITLDELADDKVDIDFATYKAGNSFVDDLYTATIGRNDGDDNVAYSIKKQDAVIVSAYLEKVGTKK